MQQHHNTASFMYSFIHSFFLKCTIHYSLWFLLVGAMLYFAYDNHLKIKFTTKVQNGLVSVLNLLSVFSRKLRDEMWNIVNIV